MHSETNNDLRVSNMNAYLIETLDETLKGLLKYKDLVVQTQL